MNVPGINVSAYAKVTDLTAATIDLTGPWHWLWQGQFRAHPNDRADFPWATETLPYFVARGTAPTYPGVHSTCRPARTP